MSLLRYFLLLSMGLKNYITWDIFTGTLNQKILF